MKTVKGLIDGVIFSINWVEIKSFHRKLSILWEFEDGENSIFRVPTVSELRSELRTILWHMHNEELTYISYANWVVFWNCDEGQEDVRAIFRVADFYYGREVYDDKNYEEELKKAIEDEDYEYAARLRDQKEKKINGQ